ncbi:hypothetical protein HUJ05_008374 [Dendroctonus ponderosae]|nr:hypothetical protein HUJ05_008374 [Dendroctonus ponderosae]
MNHGTQSWYFRPLDPSATKMLLRAPFLPAQKHPSSSAEIFGREAKRDFNELKHIPKLFNAFMQEFNKRIASECTYGSSFPWRRLYKVDRFTQISQAPLFNATCFRPRVQEELFAIIIFFGNATLYLINFHKR